MAPRLAGGVPVAPPDIGGIVSDVTDRITVQLLRDAQLFAQVGGPWLATDPFSTNRIATRLDGILGGLLSEENDELWITAVTGGRVVGAAMHAPPYPLALPRLPAGVARAIGMALLDAGRDVAGVSGESRTVSEFAELWTERTGASSSVVMRSRLYRLGELVLPSATPGDARQARAEAGPLMTEWFERFHHEATPDDPLGSPARMVERRLAAGQLWLWWDDGRPVSVAGLSAAAAGVARVGPVYTPREQRRRGYGAAVTAAASQAALRAGAEHVVLYADLANETSNSIYQAIGYLPEQDAEDRRFAA